MKHRKIIDAEFVVVRESNQPQDTRWNGIGLPPEWSGWGWFPRAAYLIAYATLLAGIFVLHHWLTGHLPLPDHW